MLYNQYINLNSPEVLILKTACVIAEFNPFHNGHKYIADMAKERCGADYVVALMSGDFVQRGAPSIISRSKRTEMALACGFDAVVALPTRYATCSAEDYARHAVRMANELGCIDTLFFGSECGEIDRLTQIARILADEPEDYREHLQEYLKEGHSFPKARALALPESGDILCSPNNILGVEYIKAILRSGSDIVPATCRREGAGHASTEPASATCSWEGAGHASMELTGVFSSATAIRGHLLENGNDPGGAEAVRASIPESAYSMLMEEYDHKRMLGENDLSFLLASSLWQASSSKDLMSYLGVTQQLANAAFAAKENCISFTDFAMQLKNRSLTYTHISRALLHIALKIEKDKRVSDIAHVLGFRKGAATLIARMIRTSSIPVITKPAREVAGLGVGARALFEEEIGLSNLYNVLVSQRSGEPVRNELSNRLITV